MRSGAESQPSERERLAAELEHVTQRCQELQHLMQLQLFLSSAGNRRRLADSDKELERRRSERRTPDRAGPGRRQLADRRTPIEEQWPVLGDQLTQLVEKSVALTEQQRLSERQGP